MSYLLVILLCLCLSGCGQDAPPPTPTAATNAEQTVPQPPTAWREGVTSMQAMDYAAAETHFTEAIKAAPQDYHAYADRGLVRALAERYEEARSDLTHASDLAPGMPTVEYNWAMYYKLQGQLDGAFAHFQNVLKKEPKNAWTLYGIATKQTRRLTIWSARLRQIRPLPTRRARRITSAHFMKTRGFKNWFSNRSCTIV